MLLIQGPIHALARCEHRAMDALDVQFSFRLFLRWSGVHVSLVTAEYFGVAAMGSIFGLILLGATLGGTVGPWLAGFIFDLAGQYFYGFLAGMISMAMGLILTLYLPSGASLRKRRLDFLTEDNFSHRRVGSYEGWR